MFSLNNKNIKGLYVCPECGSKDFFVLTSGYIPVYIINGDIEETGDNEYDYEAHPICADCRMEYDNTGDLISAVNYFREKKLQKIIK